MQKRRSYLILFSYQWKQNTSKWFLHDIMFLTSVQWDNGKRNYNNPVLFSTEELFLYFDSLWHTIRNDVASVR